MKHLIRYAFVAALATPAIAADTKITTAKHADAMRMMGQETPASDSTEVMWVGKDRMRVETDDSVTIVRTDLKKMFLLHPADKTYSTLDLPIDMKKYLPADIAPMLEEQWASMKVTVTPTTETKKFKDWTATKYTMKTSMDMMGMSMGSTADIWVTKDVTIDRTAFADLNGAIMSMMPGGAAIVAEYKKLDGFAVLTETTRSMMGSDMKSKDEVTAVESKDAPEGSYDVPKDFKEVPFDMMKDNAMGGMGPGRRGKGPGGPGRPGGGHPPGEKPVEPPKVPPTPAPK
jgi:hypothetical protein